MIRHRSTRRLLRWFAPLALACLLALPAGAADPPGSLALDWPLGLHDGVQLLPGYDVRVMQNFANVNPNFGNRQPSAVDLARNVGATIGATVYAAADGQVVCTPTLAQVDYPGRVVVVEHTLSNGAKVYTQYGHLNATLSVTNGQFLNRGTPLGTIVSWPGDPPNSHVYFEVRNFKEWTPGNCWGPGYADFGFTPPQQGWLDPVDAYFLRRPAFPGHVTTDIDQNVRSAPNRNASIVIATVAAGSRLKADAVFADQGGTDEWWHRVNYSGSSWGFTAGYWDEGWGGEIYTTDLTRYPGPLGLAELAIGGTDLYLAARAADGRVKVNRRTSAGTWAGWITLDGVATSEPAVLVNNDGRAQVFVRGTDNGLWTRRQVTAGSSSWEGWASVGGSLTSAPAVALNSDGRVQVFARWTDGALWTRAQTSAGGAWGTWTSLGGVITWGPAVARNSDGRLAVFVAGLSNNLYQIAQTTAGGAFGGFLDLGGVATSHPVVVRNTDGKLELFVRGAAPAHDLRHLKQTSAGGAWGSWQSRGGLLTSQPRVGINADGRLEAFVRGTDGALKNIWQTSAGGGWSGWNHLGGFLTSGPVVLNQGGRLQVIVRGTGDALYHTGQTPTGWSAFVNVGSPFRPY